MGIFPYVLKLLQSSARELRPLHVFIWAKILAVDSVSRLGAPPPWAQAVSACSVACPCHGPALFLSHHVLGLGPRPGLSQGLLTWGHVAPPPRTNSLWPCVLGLRVVARLQGTKQLLGVHWCLLHGEQGSPSGYCAHTHLVSSLPSHAKRTW